MYRKRAGTSGLLEALYETKLLSLLYFRAIHDDGIEEFHLFTNVDKIGAFDNICFKAKVKGFDKPVAVFIQPQHKENRKQRLTINLATYFNSYMKIRQSFHPNTTELLFKGIFDKTECLFVIYTTAEVDLSDGSIESNFSAKLIRDLIDTGGTVNQPSKYEHNIEYLTKTNVKDQVTSLAEQIAKFSYIENLQMILNNEYVLRYHVILAQKVFDVSEIQPDGYRMASVRNDFFDTNEEYLILFKDSLFKEILKRRTIKPADIRLFLSEFLGDPTDATRLSKLIGTVITYNNGRLNFDKQSTKDFRPDMKPMDVSRSTVNEAVQLAAREILTSRKFKVPAAFGNKDLTIRGSDAIKEEVINYLAWEINELLNYYKSSKMVTIGESLGDGFLQLNGGIAGAIGNIFVLDDNSKLMKITDNWESLGTLAKKLYLKLNSEIHNLHDYKFCFQVVKFPKLSFDCSEFEENLARDFLNKLLFYCNQADEEGVEKILKVEIEDYQNNQQNYYPVTTDAIFLKYHDMVQDWWTHPQHTHLWSLTRGSDLFRRSINNIIKNPLTSSINLMYMKKLQQYNYTFTKHSLSSLNLWHHNQYHSTVIVTENSILTVIKVMQYLKIKDQNVIVLDLEDIVSLPRYAWNVLRSELAHTNEGRVLILVCDKIDSRNELMKTLEDIAESVRYRTTIIITNHTPSLQIINKCRARNILHDKKLSLIDLTPKSQKSILKTATAIFPGVEIRLDVLLRGCAKIDKRSRRMIELRAEDPVVATAVADKDTGTGSHRIGDEDEEWDVPCKS